MSVCLTWREHTCFSRQHCVSLSKEKASQKDRLIEIYERRRVFIDLKMTGGTWHGKDDSEIYRNKIIFTEICKMKWFESAWCHMSLVKLCLLMQNFHAFFVILTLLFFQNDFLILYSYFVFNGGRYHLLARGFYDQILLRSYSGLQSKKRLWR